MIPKSPGPDDDRHPASPSSEAPAKICSKRVLRRDFRQARQALSPEERSELDEALRRRLLRASRLREARRIGAFWPFDGEPDLTPLLRQWASAGIEIALPVLCEHGDRLRWRAWEPGQPMTLNRYGIPEPRTAAEIELQALQALLIPVVAWDREGGRLGMGAGFYDRSLEPLASRGQAHRPLLVGVAYDRQRASTLPQDPWDVSLDVVVTETGWFTSQPGDRIA
jgi:5-formyltetrahydrofolate cyclo-ligase